MCDKPQRRHEAGDEVSPGLSWPGGRQEVRGHSARPPTQVGAEGSGLLRHFPPPAAFCATPLGSRNRGRVAVPVLICWDTGGVSLCMSRPEQQGKPQSNAQSSDTGAGVDATGD